MNTWYELWNLESGNLVASFDSRSIALEKLRHTATIRPPSWFDDLALIVEREDESDPDVVAEGSALFELVRPRAKVNTVQNLP